MKPNVERLQTLLDHMRSGNRFHETFDFSYFYTELSCGTAGCMAGELPTIWPDHWNFDHNGFSTIHLKEYVIGGTPSQLSAWFSITTKMVDHLFYQDSQSIELYGGEVLTAQSTLEQVTNNLKLFINQHK